MDKIIEEYINIFIDKNEYPSFIDEYLATPTLQRLKNVTQFCGCDYTNIYQTRAKYTRFDHSAVVAHMTWHFTHDIKESVKAVLHDHKTPCFAHTIDFVFGDYLKQEKSEKYLQDIISNDSKLIKLLARDGIDIEEVNDLRDCPVLENQSPRLCTDCLDGVLHTGYIWLQTNSIDTIRNIYSNLKLLETKEGQKEIGFTSEEQGIEFAKIVSIYAKELQSIRNKYVMMYISELIKKAVNNNLITLDDLYQKTELELMEIFSTNFSSWSLFKKTNNVIISDKPLDDRFCVHIETKKRNTIPLLQKNGIVDRITNLSSEAKKIYDDINNSQDEKYGYVKAIKGIY